MQCHCGWEARDSLSPAGTKTVSDGLASDPPLLPAPQVSEGSGRLLVVAVGESSEWGKTMALMQDAGDDTTPLQVGPAAC